MLAKVVGYGGSSALGRSSRAWFIGLCLSFGLTVLGCTSNDKTGTTTGATATAGHAGAPTGTSGKGGTSLVSGSGGTSVAGSVASGTAGTSVIADAGGTAGSSVSGSGGSAGAKAGSGGSAGKSVATDAGMMSTMDARVADASMSDDDAGMECRMLTNPLSLGGFTKCSMAVCPAQDSVCLPITFLTALNVPQSSIDLLADCDDKTKCVPSALAEQGNHEILTTCKSLLGAEGRCLSSCVPEVATQSSQLPKDVCTGSDLCAPCYDPRTGANTLACNQGCDKGPTQPAKTFDKCCSDRAFCVPPSLAGSLSSQLLKDSCTGGLVCAPKDLTDPTFKPKACASLDNAEGRCLSTCLGGAVAAQKDKLPTAGCGADEVCAPCYDPVTGKDTSACTIDGDKPTLPPYRFPQCCSNGAGTDVGVCVPPALAGDLASMLQQDTCATGRLCAPATKASDPNYKFKRCTGAGAGACVPSCILSSAEAGLFSKVTCGQGELCAPCSVLGVSTGACN